MRSLIDLYPIHLYNNIFRELIKVQQIEVEKEEEAIKQLVSEFFIDTAVYSLPDWCKFAGIEDNPSLDLQTRRENIKAALKMKEVTTVEVVKNVAESYSNGECEVVEHFSDYSFTIKFVSTVGVPSRIDEIKKIIDKIKPAHLNYNFEFKYITWGDTKKLGKPAQWYKDKGYTYEDIKEGRHLV